MRRSILAASLALAAVSTASAGDLAVPHYKAAPLQSAYSWGGGYAGLQGGYGLSNESSDIGGGNANGVAVVGSGAVPNHIKTEARGGFIGGHTGYNWQNGQIVYGLEGDINWADIKGGDTRVLAFAPISLTTTGNSGLDWFGSVRGRLGYLATQHLMLYGTGGVAFGGVTGNSSIVLAAPAPFGASALAGYNETKVGWVAGGGIEWAAFQNIRLRAEYKYLDFGSHTMASGGTVAGTPVAFVSTQKDAFHTVGVGASYALPY